MSRPKIASIVGARPQFIKCAPLSRALRGRFRELLVHTGQHYDPEMSKVFFDDLALRAPHYHLGVGSGSHAVQTGRMMARIEATLAKERPRLVLVYGDTNSTLAGALAAVKVNIAVGHVEAGLRSTNRRMPEQINRVLTDRLSALLFCPTRRAVANLKKEGIAGNVHRVGDVMYDAVLQHGARAEERSDIMSRLGLTPRAYYLATIHRASNTDDPPTLRRLLRALSRLDAPVVLPLHPRTNKTIRQHRLRVASPPVRLLPPVGYADMLVLEKHARAILTDSGGVQKEAFFFGVACVTLRDETEWVETVEAGWNAVVGTDEKAIIRAAHAARPRRRSRRTFYGDGTASQKIVAILEQFLQS